MAGGELVLVPVGLMFAGFGSYVLYASVEDHRDTAAFTSGEPDSTVGLDEGFARVEGTVASTRETVSSPFSDAECVCYEAAIQERKPADNGGTYWKTHHDARDSVPFLVEDEYGAVVVDPTDANIGVERDVVASPDAGERPADHLVEYAEWHDAFMIDAGDYIETYGPVRYTEKKVRPGDHVAVSGVAAPAPADYPTAAARIGPEDGVSSVFSAKPFEIRETFDSVESPGILSTILALLIGCFFLGIGLLAMQVPL